jgi:peptidoglycan hydrolase CwlO-like protein/surface antigen
MSKQKISWLYSLNKLSIIVLTGFVLSMAALGYNKVRADQYDQQIQALRNANSGLQGQSDSLAAVASSYEEAVNALQSQIDGLQQQIIDTQQKSESVKAQIAAAQEQLAQEKKTLGESIRAMYIEGDISTIEMLASSQNLSDYVDKQQYRNAVQDKVKTTVDKITALKVELDKQQRELEGLLADLQKQQTELSSKQADLNSKLAYTEGQKAAYDTQIKSNNSQIVALRAAQAAANRRLLGGGGSFTYSGSCGGSYPAAAAGPYGYWGCNYYKDNTLDNWGMFNRECVSYTAWMVSQTYGYMPYWGGSGNANQWPGDAVSAGIPTGSTPRAGSVAISMGGAFGHAMWVDWTDGSMIHVKQYNYDLQGNYSEMTINGAGLIYIYFN